MLTYEYHCPKCDKAFEVRMHADEVGKKAVSCPECKGKNVERLYTSFFAKTGRKS